MTTARIWRRSGGLPGSSISDFWEIARDNQDPQIPNLPLETAAGGGTVYNDTLAETLALADAYTTAQDFASALTETLAAADAYATAQVFEATLADSVATGDIYDSTLLTGGTTYNESLSESVAASDAYDTAQVFASTVTESLTPADAMLSATVFEAALSESVSPLDEYVAGMIFASTLEEALTVVDQLDNVQVMVASISASVVLTVAQESSLPGGLVWPDPSAVQAGVTYGPTGTEYTGTLENVTAFLRRR